MNRNYFPPADLYRSVCDRGLGVVRPLLAGSEDPHGWNTGSARPPSYWAYGRLRSLMTLAKARELLGGVPRRVLEVAAGDAALGACLAREGHQVTANDLLEENLLSSIARFTNGSDIHVLPGNLLEIDSSRCGLFDLVIACEIVEHVAHSIEFLRHLRGLLGPQGRILLTTPNGRYFRNKLPTYSQVEDFTALEKKQFKPDADGHLFLITPDEMQQIAAAAGLKVNELSVWATPFITGEAGFRHLGPLLPISGWYGLERTASRLPGAVRERMANAMIAVLSAA